MTGGGKREGRATVVRGTGTRGEILRAARRVLATVGYARLTMRAVAGEAGITVGNLAYHFPSKRGLVRSLILSLVADYRLKFEQYLRAAGGGGRGGFAALVRWLIEDSASRETSRLFREFWAMALHDRVVAEAMDSFYSQSHRTASALLRLAYPGLDRMRAHDLVQLMGVVSEGCNVIYATARGSRASRGRIARLAADLLAGAARDAGPAARPRTRGGRQSRAR